MSRGKMENFKTNKLRIKRILGGRYKNITEAAVYLGISRTVFYELIRRGTFTIFLPFKPIATPGRKSDKRFDTHELNQYMEDNKIPKMDEPFKKEA